MRIKSGLLNFLAVLYLCAIAGRCMGQSARDLRQGNPDYPVPEPAALISIQDNTPSLLYPSTVRTLAFSVNTIYTNGRNITAAGMEFTPLLIGNNIDQSEYLSGRLIRVLLRTRISMAATLDQGNGFHAALGLKWMLHDDADPRADSLFQRTLIKFARSSASVMKQCGTVLPGDSASFKICLTEAVSRDYNFQARIDSLRDAMKDNLWNRSVFEVAVASVYNSNQIDGSRTSLGIERYQGYFNIAMPVLERNGQIIIGFGGWTGREDLSQSYHQRGSIILRGTFGGPSERFFLESKCASANTFHPDWRAGLGSMLRVANGLWMETGLSLSLLETSWIGPEFYLRFSFGTPEIRM